MRKFIGIILGVIAFGFIGFTLAVLDVGSVSGVKMDENVEDYKNNNIENTKPLEEEPIREEVLTEKEKPKDTSDEDFFKAVNEIIVEECSKYDFDYSASFRDIKEDKHIYIKERRSKSASMIKPFIMVEVYNQVSYGNLKIFDKVKLKEEDKALGDGVLKGKEVGSEYTVRELVEYMISKSDNTATNMLIDLVGMENINNTIESLGFKDTILRRKMMDEDKKDEGIDNYTSVKDLDNLFYKLYKGECLGNEYDKVMLEMLIKCENNSKILNKLPKNIVSAHKSGELRGVQNDGGIIFTQNGDYILNILIERCKEKEAIEAISTISEKIYFLFQSKK